MINFCLVFWVVKIGKIALLVAGSFRAGADNFNGPFLVMILAAVKLFQIICWNIYFLKYMDLYSDTFCIYTAKADAMDIGYIGSAITWI